MDNDTARERVAKVMQASEPMPRGDWGDCYGLTKAKYRWYGSLKDFQRAEILEVASAGIAALLTTVIGPRSSRTEAGR